MFSAINSYKPYSVQTINVKITGLAVRVIIRYISVVSTVVRTFNSDRLYFLKVMNVKMTV